MKLKIKITGGDDINMEIPDDSKIIDIKDKMAEQNDEYFAHKIRLIFMGRLLKNEKTLGDEKLVDGRTLHAVVSKPSPPPTPPPSPPSTSPPNSISGDEDDEPFDPWADPLGNLANIPTNLTENDRMNRVLANPNIGNVITSLMNNPENLERITRINQRMESGELNHETVGEDEDYINLLREPNFMENMIQLLQNDPAMMQSISNMMSGDGTPVEMPDLQSLMSGIPNQTLPPLENLQPLENLPPTPNLTNPDGLPPMPFGDFSNNLGQIPELPVNDFPEGTDFKELYSEQLQQLAEFGFEDEERNIEVLKQTQGNVQFAMNRLLD
jgi:ubiquilin